MEQAYRKYMLNMKNESEGFNLWKEDIEVKCRIETYKEKGSIFIEVRNMMPSTRLAYNRDMEYNIIFMEVDSSGLIHHDFGVLNVDKKGDGTFYKVFRKNNVNGKGASLTNFMYVMLLATSRKEDDEQAITISKATIDLNQTSDKNDEDDFNKSWREAENIMLFNKDIDETRCDWRKIEKQGKDIIEKKYLKEYSRNIEEYGHYIIGKRISENNMEWYLGLPGRFLVNEQPNKGEGPFTLWLPILGGEKYFNKLEGEELYGYWIAKIDNKTGNIIEA